MIVKGFAEGVSAYDVGRGVDPGAFRMRRVLA
jgi:hypothetical protein